MSAVATTEVLLIVATFFNSVGVGVTTFVFNQIEKRVVIKISSGKVSEKVDLFLEDFNWHFSHLTVENEDLNYVLETLIGNTFI